MELVLKNSQITAFINKFRKEDHPQILKNLILIGIDAVSAKLKQQLDRSDVYNSVFDKGDKLTNNVQNQKLTNEDPLVMLEINLIKKEIDKINHQFQLNMNSNLYKSIDTRISKSKDPKDASLNQTILNREEYNKHYNTKQKKKQCITPKVTQVYPQIIKQSDEKKIVHRHHLDDAQLKQILTYTNIEQKQNRNPKKGRKDVKLLADIENPNQSYGDNKKISYKIEDVKTEKSLDYIKKKDQPDHRQNSGPKYLRNVQSKIKDIVKHDKLRRKGSRLNLKELEFEQNFIKSKLYQNDSDLIQNQKIVPKKAKDQARQISKRQLFQKKQDKNKKKNMSRSNSDENFSPFKNSNMNKQNTRFNNKNDDSEKIYANIYGTNHEQSRSSQFSIYNPHKESNSSESREMEIEDYEKRGKRTGVKIGNISRKNERVNSKNW